MSLDKSMDFFLMPSDPNRANMDLIFHETFAYVSRRLVDFLQQ